MVAIGLTAFTSQPDLAAVITDFDGTLSAIVDDPAAALPVDGAADVVCALARRYRRVAIVSGRPVDFLARAVGTDALLIGLYGLERMEHGRTTLHPAAVSWLDPVAAMAARAEAEAPDGVRIERKGVTFTIHVREAPQHQAWARSFADAAASATGLALHDARKSIELRPPVEIDKGTVVNELVDGLRAACFLGDDVGDLPAFDALDRFRADCGADVVRVAVKSAEAPAELIERADLLVDGPEGAVEFLRGLCVA